MHVQVDEARQQIHARRVDLVVGLRRAIGPQRQAGCARAHDPRDAVALDDDVHGPRRRRAGSVDDHDAANRECLEGARALARAAVGRRNHAALLSGDDE
jgi:hypothetical protein